jgi:hypothetical protein
MTKLFALGIALALSAGGALGQKPEAGYSETWSVTADAGRSALTIRHAALGTVMSDVRLLVRESGKLAPVEHWTMEGGAGQWTIRSDAPRIGWRIEVRDQVLVIRATSSDAVLTATVPASSRRIVARLLDPEGTPVEWVGTNEVKDGYGGSATENRSFLPRRNPDVLYFSLGQVSSTEFHALFDRRSDTAIDFGAAALLKRSTTDGDSLELTLPVKGGATVRALPEYFTRVLGVPYYVPFDDSTFRRAPMVWSSWTSYYEAVKEEDIVRNTDWLAANLKPYGFEYVQLDDGYDRGPKGEHYWIERWDKRTFPHGPAWLTQYIRSKGLKAGLWLVPNAYAGAVTEHPDWYLYDKQGAIVRDYNTPALDSSNPAVLEFVRHMFTTLDDWGFDYYKFDGEHALPRYIPAVDRHRLHDPNGDALVNYRRRLEIIRETLGPKRFIEGCPAGTPLNGIGFFNSYFTGHDLYNTWLGMYPLFSSINANVFLNHLLVYVMPGEGLELGLPMLVEEAAKKRPKVVIDTARTREAPLTTFGLNDAEARTLVTYVALTGVAYPLASVMPELPAERVQLLKATMPTLPILPVDLFSRGVDIQWNTFLKEKPDFYQHNYPEILDLKVNSAAGNYDVVALTNWQGAKSSRNVELSEKLGVEPGGRFVGFDFWNQKPLGIVQNQLQLDVEAHDTRVVLLHPLLDRPQLIGLSRHISGTQSVLEQTWNGSTNQLHGKAETVAGDPYAVWVNVPERWKLVRARATASSGADLPLEQQATGSAVMIRFAGQAQPVDWTLQFANSK